MMPVHSLSAIGGEKGWMDVEDSLLEIGGDFEELQKTQQADEINLVFSAGVKVCGCVGFSVVKVFFGEDKGGDVEVSGTSESKCIVPG
jgi:hypothetical protein